MSNENGNVGQSPAELSMSDQPDFADFNSMMSQIEIETDEGTQATTEVDEPAQEIANVEPVETEQTEDAEETPEIPKIEKQGRTSEFNRLKEEVTAISTERDDLKTKVEKFDGITERYGGIENFIALEESFVSVILDPAKAKDTVQLLDGLPHGQTIRSEIMFDSIGLTIDGQAKQLDSTGLETVMSNQALVLNAMLKGYQGVDANIQPAELETIASYLALQFSENRDEFLQEIKRQTEIYVDPKDREIRKLQAQIAEKSQPKPQSTPEQADPLEQNLRIIEEMQTFHNDVSQQIFKEVEQVTGRSLADKYQIGDAETLPKPIREANDLLRKLIQSHVQLEMNTTDAQTSLITYLATTPKNHPTFAVTSRPYKQAVRAKAEAILRSLAPRLNATVSSKPAAPKAVGGTEPGVGLSSTENSGSADWSSFGQFS